MLSTWDSSENSDSTTKGGKVADLVVVLVAAQLLILFIEHHCLKA